jgi:di/tricarboxylate transporter
MNTDLAVVLVLLAAAIAMFAINKPRMDAVALIMMTVLPFTGVITMGEALAGFSDATIVLLGALFVIGEGLVRTGVAQRLGDWLIEKAGSSETRLLALLMGVVAALGAFMSSTGVVAIFIPVALRIAQSTGAAPSRLMMPISVAALISGMMTLIATAPNLVVNSELVRHGAAGFHFFSFTPFGVPVLILGIIYMLVTRRWLTPKDPRDADRARRPSLQDWIEAYKLADREYRLRVTEQSPPVGKTLGELDLRDTSGANVFAIERTRRFSRDVIAATAKTELQANDILLVDLFAPRIDIEALRQRFALEALPLTGAYFSDRAQEIGMAEVMVAADSELVGKTVVDAEFRTRYRLTVIGLRHVRLAAGLQTRRCAERSAPGDGERWPGETRTRRIGDAPWVPVAGGTPLGGVHAVVSAACGGGCTTPRAGSASATSRTARSAPCRGTPRPGSRARSTRSRRPR